MLRAQLVLVGLCFTLLACATSHAEDKFRALPSTKDRIIRLEFGKKKGKIPLKMDKGSEIEKFLTTPAKDLQILAYQFVNAGFGGSQVVAVDPKTLKELWRYDLEGVNLSVPFVHEDFIYVASMGHVAKLDITSGKVAWEHKNLYDQYEFNGGEDILKKGDLIQFAENLSVNDQSGEVQNK